MTKGNCTLKKLIQILQFMATCFLSTALSVAMAADIVVGQIGPFTGLPSPDAQEVHEGASAYFEQINKSGGIYGKKISFFKLDDQFNKPDVFKAQFAKAVDLKPVALISPIGSVNGSLLVKETLLTDANFLIVNAIPGSNAIRNPGHPKLFHVRASDIEQYNRVLDHGRTTGVIKMHVLYQDLPIGTGGFEILKKNGPDYGYKSVTGTLSKHDDAALIIAAKTSLEADPQTVFVIGTPKFMADAVQKLRLAGFTRSISALSYLPSSLAVKIAGKEGARGVAIAQTFPNPNGRTLPLQQEFQKTMAQFGLKNITYSAFHLEGYLSARILIDSIKRAKGNTSIPALTAALRETGDFDYGGFRVNFSKNNAGSSWTDIGVIDIDGKLRY
jgi:branched-chain amino acid transport system substrate-binding protein